MTDGKVNILLVDDHPAKLMTYEVILQELGENLITVHSARAAFDQLLKHDIAVILIDVCMPDIDGYQLAAMIREHPRFADTAIIFVSGVFLSDVDRVRGYAMGAVDYVPVPVVPEVLRAKVKIFVNLYRKTRALEELNRGLEDRVAERTAELSETNARLTESEELRTLALAAGQMGTWEWDLVNDRGRFDEGQCKIFGVDPASFEVTLDSVRALIHPEDWDDLAQAWARSAQEAESFQAEFRVQRYDGTLRYCAGTVVASGESGQIVRLSGVTLDITERKEAEKRQAMLAREVDHRAMNVLTVVQSIVRLTRAKDIEAYVAAVESRIRALALAHVLLSKSRWQGAELEKLVEEELAPYRVKASDPDKIVTRGQNIMLEPATAQTVALALHELATNAAKYGALSAPGGRVRLSWDVQPDSVLLRWVESGGPSVNAPDAKGFGTRIIGAIIEGQLGGETTFDWRPNGLQCTLTIPCPAGLTLPGETGQIAAAQAHIRAAS